jgi:ATP-dependent protease ClpP protease subunit
MRLKPRFAAQTAGTTLELLFYDEIGENFWSGGGVTAQSVADAIKQAGAFDRITLRINSPGGDCFEGVAIYNLIRSQGKPVDCFVDGLAASAASIIAMAGDTVSVGVGAMIMIHNAACLFYGDAPAFLKIADTLEKITLTVGGIYVKKTGQTADEIKTLMDGETWMGAEDAVDKGFADAIVRQDEDQTTQARALVKSFNLRGFKHVPANLRATKPRAGDACECECDFCPSGDCSNCNCQGGCTAEHCAASDCNCDKAMIGSHANLANGDGKTKRVDGEDLEKSAFAYQGSEKLADWKLPIKFSTDEKSASHIRNAIARWKSTDMPDAAEKDKARGRVKAAAKEHDIEIADGSLDDASDGYFEALARQRLSLYERSQN